ncbi:MAG: TIGR03619 family F420-dependent LLM class oxidoreductase [Nonomuraea sp.]|nr:TIGR03619 family F420-dependent LLM class oxidoreductase [Nonomuraea sp.]NUP69167.1 TIGR03619 family F420-dependent LLM class oxidoreductase [Nonomuraea sp.]NUP82523.1 TIGR03619 family F420-dependent LLM class oxidoreductase [Nonomuraea sp.]NUS09051.1 TIGR03619 family F420-dependent LLM class oxidoreductase [Nonomuraea sp.]NUT12796.1 TIGR03619 family F420-dependent LLM class oxidoreductase [Nonomuraea sp.]
MDLGIGLPCSGRQASPEAIVRVAQAAERAGLGSLWTFERLLRPSRPTPVGFTEPLFLPENNALVYDPLETLTYVAATTSTIRLGTSVLNTLFHNPVVLARRLATLDRLSGGRALIGLGQGWMQQEFDTAGVPGSRRGAGFEEHIEAMRACWGPDPVSFEGRFYTVPESEIGPKPTNLTLLAGAQAPAAMARAARMGLGLTVVVFDWDQLTQSIQAYGGKGPLVAQVNGSITDQPLPQDRAPLTGSAEQVAADLVRARALGVDHVFWHTFDWDPDEAVERVASLNTY